MLLEELIDKALEDINSFPAVCLIKVLERLCNFMECQYGVILTVNKQKQEMTLDILYGYPETDVLRYRSSQKIFNIETDKLVSISAYNEGKTVIEDGESNNHYELTEGVSKILSHPVKGEAGEINAILTLESTLPDAFNEYETQIAAGNEVPIAISLCGNLIAAALDARQSLLFKFNEFIKLRQFSETVELAEGVVEWIRNAFKVNSCAIYFSEYKRDEFKSELRSKVSIINNNAVTEARNRLYNEGEGYAGWVFAYNHYLYLPEFEKDDSTALENYENVFGERPRKTGNLEYNFPDINFKSYIGVPLGVGAKKVGVLEILETSRDYTFESDVPLLKTIGSRIAEEFLTINKNRRREQIYTIPNIQTGDFQKVIRGVVDACMAVTEASHGFFMEKRVNLFHPRAVKGYKLVKSEIPLISVSEETLLKKALGEKSPVYYTFSESDQTSQQVDSLLSVFSNKTVKTFLFVPVQVQKETDTHDSEDKVAVEYEDLGVLVLVSTAPDAFQEEEILIAALAEIVSYNIWGNRKLSELNVAKANILRLEQSMSLYNRVVTAAATSAGSVHTAKKHIKEVLDPLEWLSKQQKIKTDAKMLEKVTQIQNGINDLDEYYKKLHNIYSGSEPKASIYDLFDLIKEARTYMNPTFEERKITFKSSVKQGEYKVLADELLFKVVMINLIRNSIEANAREIKIRAERAVVQNNSGFIHKVVRVYFEDNGRGIPEDKFQTIFEEFVTFGKEGGTGLGLPVNKDILSKLKGEFNLVKSEIGKGAIFEIILREEDVKSHNKY